MQEQTIKKAYLRQVNNHVSFLHVADSAEIRFESISTRVSSKTKSVASD